MAKTQVNHPGKERSRGRPADVESGAMQSRLLDAAEELFAEQGYAATSVRQLADAAGANPALVHYYFKNKQGLLRAVLDRALEPMAQGLAMMRQGEDLDLIQIAHMMFTMAGQHPALPKLIVREVLLSGGETQAVFIEHFAPRLGGALPGLIRQAQHQGSIDEELDPGIATLMILSLCMFPFVARSIAEPQLGIRYDEAGRQAYLDHLSRLFERGISP